MYGVTARLPVDIENSCLDALEWEPLANTDRQSDRLREMTLSIENLRKTAQKNLGEAQLKQKKAYDLKHKAPTYNVGDKVLRYNRRRDTRMGDKLGNRFMGPYQIHEVLGRGVYRLKDGETVLKQIVNATNLKIWHPASPLSSPSKVPTPDPSPQAESPQRGTDSKTKSPERRDPQSPPESTPQKKKRPGMWIDSLNLTVEDHDILMSGGWLNDRLIDAVNSLVAKSVGAEANQSTLLVQTAKGFKPVEHETVLVLHDANHWITVACAGGQVLYADSMGGKISQCVSLQVRQLFSHMQDKRGRIPVMQVVCDRQMNSSDCGVYAAAVAFDVACDGANYLGPQICCGADEEAP